VYSLDAFRWAVFGHRVTVVTDHSALKWLFTLKGSSGKLLRWAMRVLEYDALIQHRPGKQHGNADMLSRFGTTDEAESALVDCEDGLREMPDEGSWGRVMSTGGRSSEQQCDSDDESVSEHAPQAAAMVTALLHLMQVIPVPEGVSSAAAARYVTVDGYLLDLAAGEPARMTLATADGEDNELIGFEGVDAVRSMAPREVYKACKAERGERFSEDSAAGVLLATAELAPAVEAARSRLPPVFCAVDGVLWQGSSGIVVGGAAASGETASSWLPEGQLLLAAMAKLTPVVLTRASKSGIGSDEEQQRQRWIETELSAHASTHSVSAYNGSQELLRGAVLVSADSAERAAWEQLGGVFILHSTAVSTVRNLRAARQAWTSATAAASPITAVCNVTTRRQAARRRRGPAKSGSTGSEQEAWLAQAEGASSIAAEQQQHAEEEDSSSSEEEQQGETNRREKTRDTISTAATTGHSGDSRRQRASEAVPEEREQQQEAATGVSPAPKWDAPDGVELREWAMAQRSDAALAPWFDYLELQRLPKDRSRRRAVERDAVHFKLVRGEGADTTVLVHLGQRAGRGEIVQLVVPSGLRRRVLRSCHDSRWCGHVGPDKTLARTRISYWWTGQSDDCLQYCRSCVQCQQRKRPWSKQQVRLHWPVSRAFQRVAMDLLDIQIVSSDGSRYVMVVHEYFTGWKYLFALKAKDPVLVAQCLAEVIRDHGVCEELLSDFGGEFVNEVNTALVTKFGMRRLRTTPYHPQTDGAVERSNAVVLEMLTQLAAVHKLDWPEHLLAVTFALRTAVDLNTGLTPFFLLYGRDARLPDSFVEPVQALHEADAEGVNTDVGLLRRLLMGRVRVLEAQARRGLAYSEHNSKLRRHEYVVGDLVLVYRPKVGELEPRYKGPYRIEEDVNGGGVTFRISRRNRNGRLIRETLHASMFKPFIARRGWLEQDDHELEVGEQSEESATTAAAEPAPVTSAESVPATAADAVVVDQVFLDWLDERQRRAGAVKSDLIAVTESCSLNGAMYYKLDFRGWRTTGWVPQYVVLHYWDSTRLDTWAATQRLPVEHVQAEVVVRAEGRDEAPAKAANRLASYPIGTRVASRIFNAASGLREWYAGRVVGYDARKKWFRVRYEDGDGMELTKTEVVKGVNDYLLHFVAGAGRAAEEQ
jgi:Integrase zinc binding domain/RNase H-like domain found in reverse transcriptase